MAVDIHKLIAAISPDVYCSERILKNGESDSWKDKTLRDLVKRIAKEKGYLEAAEKAELIQSGYIDIIHTRFARGVFKLEGLKNPYERHFLVYDMFSQSLEPLYFWMIDFINEEYGKTEKLIDNFVSSASSGLFAEMQGRATRMQEEAFKMFGNANTVLRSVLNVVYDLKEFKIRLSLYDDYRKGNEDKKRAALLSLKQLWIDNVDAAKRGTSSIKGFAQQFEYVTIIDAFMVSNSLEDIKKLDLNDRVKRILEQRVPEFLKWVDESESELRKRFEIEKNYLRSQVNALKLYARWIKPYLRAAKDLEQRANPTSALVNAFNTALFELTVLGQDKYDPIGDIALGELPKYFKDIKLRNYSPLIIVEFKYRSVPERTDQRGGYTYRGKAEVVFTSYALNNDELKELRENLEKDDIGDMYKLIEGSTTESLGEIQKDIDAFLEDKKEDEKEEKSGDINPFTALFSFLKSEKKSDKKDEKKDSIIKSDSSEEKAIRSQASLEARWKCRKVYDTFKKSLDMPAFPPVL